MYRLLFSWGYFSRTLTSPVTNAFSHCFFFLSFIFWGCPLIHRSSQFLWSSVYLCFLLLLSILLVSSSWYCCQVQWHEDFSSVSSENILVLTLKFRSLSLFDRFFICSVRWGSNFILLQVDIQFFQHQLLKRWFFLYWMVLALFFRNSLAVYMRIYFLAFLVYSIGLYISPYGSTILVELL